jgi:hypothetical protein
MRPRLYNIAHSSRFSQMDIALNLLHGHLPERAWGWGLVLEAARASADLLGVAHCVGALGLLAAAVRVRRHAGLERRPKMMPLNFADNDVQLSVADLPVTGQGLRQRLKKSRAVADRQGLGGA